MAKTGKGGGGGGVGGSPLPTVAGLDSDVNADINVTPMVDVMLVLLIIFMVITPALAGYVVKLPTADTSESEKDERVTLGIDIQGRFYIEDSDYVKGAVPETELPEVLTREYRARPDDHVLYMKADIGVAYSVVLTAIDAAREAGVRRIGFITDPIVEEEP